MEKEKKAMVLLNMIPEIGPRRFLALMGRFGGAEKVVGAGLEEIKQTDGFSAGLAEKIFGAIKTVDVEKEIELANNLGVEIITYFEKQYPESLKNIPDAPPVIYVRGAIVDKDVLSVGIVGTRRPTNYGRAAASRFAKEMAEVGITSVSGLARGIDTEAHKSSLHAGGRTIAVVGSGLNVHYPPENRKLEDAIAKKGAVVSEFPLSQPPDKQNFPRRNRLISGLSLGTLVVEADMKSGSLITARYCADQGREVFSVPGPIFSEYSKGANYLIKSGAHLAEDVHDIIEILKPLSGLSVKPGGKTAEDISPESKIVLDFVKSYTQGAAIDLIVNNLGRTVSEVSAALFDLEIKGYVRSLPGKIYIRT